MRNLQHDRYARGTLRKTHSHVSGLHFILIFASIALLVLSRLQHPWINQIETAVADHLHAPMRAVAARIERITDLHDRFREALEHEPVVRKLREENARLRAENRRLSQSVSEREALARLVKLVPNRTSNRITARVIARGDGPFRHVLTIDVGRQDGVRRGHPITADGTLVGHIAWVGERAARVLLVTDERSRIPVIVGRSNTPAIAAGARGAGPRLLFVPRGAPIRSGDRVVTSGAANVLPIGLPLGQVKEVDRHWHVTTGQQSMQAALVQVVLHAPMKLSVRPPTPPRSKPISRVVRALSRPAPANRP